jgi:hypothetical protein
MITKITTGLISWKSERLWATLQEWHCSSVCKFLRGKVIYYSAYGNTVQLSTIVLHMLIIRATTQFVLQDNFFSPYIALTTRKITNRLTANIKYILTICQLCGLTQINTSKKKNNLSMLFTSLR